MAQKKFEVGRGIIAAGVVILVMGLALKSETLAVSGILIFILGVVAVFIAPRHT